MWRMGCLNCILKVQRCLLLLLNHSASLCPSSGRWAHLGKCRWFRVAVIKSGGSPWERDKKKPGHKVPDVAFEAL